MISAVVLVKNQEDNLERCLKSLAWCKELVVIDDDSTDNSAKVAQALNAKVFKHRLDDDFSKQRNFALRKVTQEWVLFIDADEVVSPELAEEIYQQTTQFLTPFNGFFIKRVDYMWNKKIKHGEVGSKKLLRLARVEKGEWRGKVHEIWEVSGSKGELKNPILHFPHPTVREFLSEINYYSTLRAKDLYEKGVNSTLWEILLFPSIKFFYNYILKLGMLDGIQGLLIALLMSMHSFLVRGKLWQLHQVKRDGLS